MNDEAEISWAAGLFEGEGTITKNGTALALRVNGTDPEPILRFAQVVGHGKVYGPYARQERDGYTRKPVWIWVAQGEAGLKVLEILAPWLSDRRLVRALDLLPTLSDRVGFRADRAYARIRRIRRRNVLIAQAE